MTDREKVIKGLECCIIADDDYYPECEKCPYRDTDGDTCDTMRPLFSDALELLKAQRARVMTLMEVLAAEVVYAEDVDKADIISVLVDGRTQDRIALVSPSLMVFPLISEYGKRWRCWTSRPTDEQREAVKWE